MLTFTVIEIAPLDGYSIIRAQVGSDSPNVTTGDTIGMAVTNEIALINEVGTELKL